MFGRRAGSDGRRRRSASRSHVSRVTGRRRHDVNRRDRNARTADRRGRRSRVPASERRRSQRLLGLAGRRRALDADAQRHVEHFLVEGQFLAQQAAAVVLHYRAIGANSGTDEMKNKKEKKPARFQPISNALTKVLLSIIFNEAPLFFHKCFGLLLASTNDFLSIGFSASSSVLFRFSLFFFRPSIGF